MFTCPGKKIKKVAFILFWFALILNLIGACCLLVFMVEGTSVDPLISFMLFLLQLFLGSVAAWVGALLVYGFGDLIDRANSIDEKIKKS